MYKVLIGKKATKFLAKLDVKSYRIISDAINKLVGFREAKNLDVKPLKRKFDSMWRLRTGTRRILFTVNDEIKEIKIWIVGDRGDVY